MKGLGKGKTAITLLTAVSVLLAGCGTESGTATATETDDAFTPKLDTEAEATVNIIGSLQNFESLEEVINDFLDYYPNCEVQYECIDDYKGMLATRLASDDTVDIFMITNLLYTGEVAEKCADLAQEDIDMSAIRSESISSSTADDGKLYELPLANNTYGLIVNTTLLEEEELSVPTNYEEFLSVCESLKEKGYTPVQGYPTSVDLGVIWNMAYVLMNQTYDTQEKLATLSAGEEGCAEILLPAFELLCDLYEKGYIDESVNETYEDNYDKAILRFFEGDVPFLGATTETFSGTKKRETKSESYSADPFDYEFICTPISEEGAYSYITTWQGFALNEDGDGKEWAVEFLRFLATEEEINELAYIKGLPSVTNNSDDDRFAGLYSDEANTVYTNSNYFSSGIDDAFWDTVAKIPTGELDAAGAVEEMESMLRASSGETEGES